MPRLPRSVFPAHGVWHVTTRGVAQRPVFLNDEDRVVFLRLLRDVRLRWRWHAHAFCLMTNHYHLLIEGTRTNLSRGFQKLNLAYARRFNHRHVRWGHVFGERFWSAPIADEEHLSATALYIVYNPVRAGLCEHPSEWPWLGSRYGLETP